MTLTSPIDVLVPHIPSSLELCAPERVNELIALPFRPTLDLDDRPGFLFRALPHFDHIRASRCGIEYLWVLAYTGWTVTNRFVTRSTPSLSFDFAADPNTAPVPTLLDWALRNQKFGQQAVEPWPSASVIPRFFDPFVPDDTSASAVATEVALMSTAWILHHELTHVRLHKETGNRSLLELEEEADWEATCWLLDKAPSEALLKRGVGVGVALAAIAGLCLLHGRAESSSHPHPADRLERCLRHPHIMLDDRIHLMLALLLDLHMFRLGYPQPNGDYLDGTEALAAFCDRLRISIR